MNNNLIIGLPERHAQTKNGGRRVCATERQNGGRIRSPPPPPPPPPLPRYG